VLSEPSLPGRGRCYGLATIGRFCQFVLDAACSLRGSSAVLNLLAHEQWPDEQLPGESGPTARGPAANTGQMWLLQLGLYELQRPKEQADDWVWVIDHAVQAGTLRCLIIAGCRASLWQAAERPLEHQDLSVFALDPVEKSDGATVARQLEQATAASGIVPRAILCDQGSDLIKGVAGYRQAHPQTVLTHDIAHRTANEMKRELEADPRWKKFSVAAGAARQRLTMTPLAHLSPPKLRSKARYMNLEKLLAWGGDALRYLDDPQPVDGVLPDGDVLRAKLGWLTKYRTALAEWGAAMQVVASTLTYIRRAGYHSQAADELGPQLCPARSAMAQRVAERLLDFVRAQSAQAQPAERLPGSSECLESLIGKGKRLEGPHSQSGFTKMILGLAAAVVRPTQDYLTAALTKVNNSDVQIWCRDHLGISLAAKRHQALTPHPGTKPGQLKTGQHP